MMSSVRSLLDRLRRRKSPTTAERVIVRAPPSPTIHKEHGRMAQGRDVYGITAVQYTTLNCAALPRPELYIRTRCAAIAKYILFEHDVVGNWPVWHIPPLDISSQEHRDFSLRMRRCGAIMEEDTRTWQFDDRWYGVTEVRQHPNGCAFGWPSLVDGKQPVWVYHDAGVLEDGWWAEEDILQQQLYDLNSCDSMEDYCQQLQSMGAVYYSDVQTCPAAREAGIMSVT